MRVERKVAGGKFLRMTADPSGAVRLTGDFFLHPEEGIDELERICHRCLPEWT